MRLYTRKELRKIIKQTRVRRGNTYTSTTPSHKSIATVISALSNTLGCVGEEFTRLCPKGLKALGMNFYSVRYGKVSFRMIALIQYVVDNANFIYLEGLDATIEWLKSDNYKHIKILNDLYLSQTYDPYNCIDVEVEAVNIERKLLPST